MLVACFAPYKRCPNRKDDHMIRTSMPSSFVKLLLSGVLAVSLTAMPVQARDHSSNDDSGALIAALLGLVTLGVILSNDNDDSDNWPGKVDRPRDPKPRKPHRPGKVSKFYKIPKSCLHNYKTQRGHQKLYNRYCMHKKFKYANELPSVCEKEVVILSKDGIFEIRRGYKPRCLSKRGYRAAGY